MNNKSLNIYLQAFAILLIFAVYFFGLFIDLTGDSGLYAAISRQMVESGDWLNLKLNGQAYDQKPHLLFWLAGLGIKLFGNTNFAFKFFPTLYGFLGLYFIYRLGKTLYSTETGKLAVVIAVTSQIFFLYFFDIHADTILQTGVVLALWQLALYLKENKAIHFLFGFVGIGLAMLSKGPIGAVIPFFAILLYVITKKNFKQLFHPKWILGILIVLFIISPSLFHLFRNFGWEGIQFYFITNNFGRISGEYAGSSSDPFFYIYNLLWAVLPWTIFVLSALFFEIKSWTKNENSKSWSYFLTGSMLLFLLILSIAKGKAPNYFLIVIPLISVITANWLIRQKSTAIVRKVVVIQYIIIVVLTLAFISILLFLSEISLLFSILILTGLIGLLVFTFLNFTPIKRIILLTAIIAGALNLLLNTTVIPHLFSYQGARQALGIYEQERKENDILLNFHLEEYELFYYANSPVQEFTNWDDFYTLFRQEGTWIYTTQGGFDGIKAHHVPLNKIYVIEQKGMNNLTLAFLNPKSRHKSLDKNYLIRIH